ncbi:hypothetical protein LINPERHAP2_LOCUS16352 [Linum perenne]
MIARKFTWFPGIPSGSLKIEEAWG